MPITTKIERINEGGSEKDAFIATFTNGAKDQLNDLKNYFKQPNELELLKLAISFLQKIKEDQEKGIK